MTELWIDGRLAELAEDSSFTFFTESRLFSDAQGYTLDIELPLKGCAANRAIFGRIELDPPASASWPATLKVDGMAWGGTALLTDVTATTVKVQFLMGRSTAAYSAAAEKYIDELNLDDAILIDSAEKVGSFPVSLMTGDYAWINSGDFQNRLPPKMPAGGGSFMAIPSVALPWMNDTEGTLQNGITSGNPDVLGQWARRTGFSWMPFLYPLATRICAAAGYSCNFKAWRDSDLVNLIVCNAVPAERAPQLEYRCGRALPHWTVQEFFDNLQPILGGIFSWDHFGRSVSFDFAAPQLAAIPPEHPEDVEDEYDITSSYGMEETDGSYLRAKPFRFADPGTDCWKFMDCPWILSAADDHQDFPTLEQLVQTISSNAFANNQANHRWVYVAKDADAWFTIKANHIVMLTSGTSYRHTLSYAPVALNLFGPEDYGEGKEDREYEELKVLPVPVVDGIIHLSPQNCFDMTAYLEEGGNPADLYNTSETVIEADSYADALAQAEAEGYQTPVVELVEAGEPEKRAAAYDHLFVGYWRGVVGQPGKHAPDTCGFQYVTGVVRRTHFDMRINNGHAPWSGLPRIDESTKYTFRFLSRRMPDVNAIFHINGRRWLCKRLETTFTARGRSERITGEFYPIVGE